MLFFLIASKGVNLDTLCLDFRSSSQNNCFGFCIKVLSKDNFVLRELTVNDSQTIIKIPIQKGTYDVLVESKINLPTVLKNVSTNRHYFIFELYRDPVISDTIYVEPVDSVVVQYINHRNVPNLKLSESENLIANQLFVWESPFQLNWDCFKICDSLGNMGVNDEKSEMLCDIYVDINKPSCSLNSKSFFRKITRKSINQNDLYLDNNYYNVFAYVNKDFLQVSKDHMTDDELIYYRVIFNIYELYARKLRCYFSNNNSKKIYLFKENIILHSKDNCNNMIKRFEIETNFGKNINKLYQWHLYIYNQLGILIDYKYKKRLYNLNIQE